MYQTMKPLDNSFVSVSGGVLRGANVHQGRLILQGGMVVDPKNKVEEVADVAILGDRIHQVAPQIPAEKGDRIISADGLLVLPGLFDMHLHLGDLFDVDTASITNAVQDGVTTALSPGAGNTFMAPALLGAEMDRGLPLNAGVFLGAANVLGSSLDDQELCDLFCGVLPWETACQRLSLNPLVNQTAPLVVGIKDHSGHFIMPDDQIRRLFSLCRQAGLLYLSHTQNPLHAARMERLSQGVPLHLTHATAVGVGSSSSAVDGMNQIFSLCKKDHVTADFVTTMIRRGCGSREGLQMHPQARALCLDALHSGLVNILVSDGQNQSVMKGFGDTRDNIPALLELVEEGVLTLSQAVATMTQNPVHLLSQRTQNTWWEERLGHLGAGALANVTVVDPHDKLATYTIVNGVLAAFENRLLRTGYGAGRWVSRFGMTEKMGIGDMALFN